MEYGYLRVSDTNDIEFIDKDFLEAQRDSFKSKDEFVMINVDDTIYNFWFYDDYNLREGLKENDLIIKAIRLPVKGPVVISRLDVIPEGRIDSKLLNSDLKTLSNYLDINLFEYTDK